MERQWQRDLVRHRNHHRRQPSGHSVHRDSPAFSYTQTGNSTFTTEGESSFSFYGAGCYSNGSYAYSSWTRDRDSDSSSTFSSSTAFNQDASGTWVNRTTGISTSGVNRTFVYTASAGNTFEQSQSASDGWTEHEEGTYSGYRWNVSSGTFDEGSAFTSSYSSAGSSSASDGTAFSANSSFSGSCPCRKSHPGRFGLGQLGQTPLGLVGRRDSKVG